MTALQFPFLFLRRISRWLFWPAVALVVWGELTPAPPALLSTLWDKAEHFAAYLVLAALATLALGLGRRLAWALFAILLLGVVLEILQRFTGRTPDVRDVIANTLGAAAGLCLAAVFVTLVEPTPDDYPSEK